MNIVSWDPFRDINQIFNRYSRYDSNDRSDSNPAKWSPLVDIYETEQSFLLRAELPGIDKDAVSVSVDKNVLSIKGEKQFNDASDGEKWQRIETQYGDFNRQFTLPEDVDADKIVADYQNGVLELVIPKIEPAKPKMIDVKVH